jgi:cyanophycinase
LAVDDPDAASKLAGAGGLFISGGSQNRFMERVPPAVREGIRALWRGGGVVAGTSAGASVLSSAMLARGPAEETPAPDEVDLAEGLGLLEGAIVDQHFSERGRIGRLVAAVAQRRDLLGVGIDEDTALIVERGRMLALGAGSVYLLDAVDRLEFRLRVLASGDAVELA